LLLFFSCTFVSLLLSHTLRFCCSVLQLRFCCSLVKLRFCCSFKQLRFCCSLMQLAFAVSHASALLLSFMQLGFYCLSCGCAFAVHHATALLLFLRSCAFAALSYSSAFDVPSCSCLFVVFLYRFCEKNFFRENLHVNHIHFRDNYADLRKTSSSFVSAIFSHKNAHTSKTLCIVQLLLQKV
jgi:hypothetical protein